MIYRVKLKTGAADMWLVRMQFTPSEPVTLCVTYDERAASSYGTRDLAMGDVNSIGDDLPFLYLGVMNEETSGLPRVRLPVYKITLLGEEVVR